MFWMFGLSLLVEEPVQYMVHWTSKAHSKGPWISAQELKKLDDKLWEDLVAKFKVVSSSADDDDAGA